MPTAIFPSPLPIQGAVVASNRIAVTHVVEQTSERIRFDIHELIRIPVTDEPWNSCFVPTDQIEPETSDWGQILSISAPGTYVIGRSSDGKFYEVAVCSSYFPWLVSHKFEFELGLHYDLTEPVDAEIQLYGRSQARRRAQAHFLESLTTGISSGRGRRFEQYCRRIAPDQLQIPLERAILNYRVLTSDPQVRKNVCQWLVVNSLSLAKVSNCRLVFELLRKDQDQLLQGFRKDHTDILEDLANQWNADFHSLSLHWLLLVSCGGEDDDFRPRKLDPKFTANDNANIIGSLVGITGSNRFGDFDSQAMLNALSHSKVFTQHEISRLEIAKLTSKMMASLPIGFPKGYLDLPTEVLYGLGTGAVDEVRAYWSRIYRQQPSLNNSDNNILVVLTWSSITSDVCRNFGGWAASDDGLNLRRRLLKDVQESQATEQLALSLAAWLCLQRLPPYSPDTTQSIKGCFLADFDALLTGERLSNECTVLEHMIFSFSQGLSALGGDYQNTCQFLNTVLEIDTLALGHPDQNSVQYWMYRTKRLAHKAARSRTQWFPLCMLQSSKSFLVGASAAALSAMHDLICRIQFFFAPALWYDFWTVVSGVMLYASIFRYLESSSACKIILFSTCGEFSALLKCVHVRHCPQQPDRWFLLACASLSFLKFTLTCGLFFVGWSELIGIGGVLAFSALIICGFQAALSRIYRVIAQSVEHDSSAMWRKVRDLETAPDVDVESEVHNLRLGRQHLRKDALAALHSEFDYTSCTLARLSNLGTHKEEEMSTKLNEVGRLYGVFGALELPDESMEMVILKSYIPELQYRLGEIFPGCHFDPIYDPTEPSREDVERLYVAAKNSTLPAESGEMIEDVKRCHTAAKILRIDASSSRARAMIKEGPGTVAAAYYSCFLERNMTWLKENASYDRIEAECCGQFESGVGGVSYLFLLANDGGLFSRGKASA